MLTAKDNRIYRSPADPHVEAELAALRARVAEAERQLSVAVKLLRWWQKHHGSDAMTDQFLAGAIPSAGPVQEGEK